MDSEHTVTYERQPVGNTLIDEDAGTVFIRIYPDRRLGRGLAWFFAISGVLVLVFAAASMSGTTVGILRSVPALSAAGILLVTAFVVSYNANGGVTTILASAEGIEYTAGGFAPRNIARSTIQRVFSRDTPMSKHRMSICLKLADGSDVVLGSGEAKDIEAMARALHRILNE